MDEVIPVDMAEREVEIRPKEAQKRRKVTDAYNVEDPFFEEDKVVGAFECTYRNFYCLSGEAPENFGVERERKEASEKKEKREISRERYQIKKMEALEKCHSVGPEEVDSFARDLVVLEVLTSQDLSAESLLEEVKEKIPGGNPRLFEGIRHWMGESGLRKIQDGAEAQEREALERVKEEISRRVKEKKEEKIVFDDELLDVLAGYVEVQYLLFYVRLFSSGKKRVLEHKVKKNIVKELQEVFPVGCRSASLGKKIASYVTKKSKGGGAKRAVKESDESEGSEESRGEDLPGGDGESPNNNPNNLVVDREEKSEKTGILEGSVPESAGEELSLGGESLLSAGSAGEESGRAPESAFGGGLPETPAPPARGKRGIKRKNAVEDLRAGEELGSAPEVQSVDPSKISSGPAGEKESLTSKRQKRSPSSSKKGQGKRKPPVEGSNTPNNPKAEAETLNGSDLETVEAQEVLDTTE
ncbi:uncharacterized protein NEMAJ01_1814 [Nematocida major]|uniref:uncharacterized protein n=1 Tax=Nematocida major TaxID=1912982 RepID=UPI0020080DCA|nr:uncharacterized protein NEMAJ01_1814 [Nematocida major]KAH9386918.1 hypothetical protein NEMAJ01_1814 [Nematocida major]